MLCFKRLEKSPVEGSFYKTKGLIFKSSPFLLYKYENDGSHIRMELNRETLPDPRNWEAFIKFFFAGSGKWIVVKKGGCYVDGWVIKNGKIKPKRRSICKVLWKGDIN